MKKLKYLFAVLFLSGIMVSCNNGQSLQQYLVDNSDEQGFLSADLSASLLNVAKIDDLTEEQKEAYKSVKKMNILAFVLKEDNKEVYELEKLKVKEILKNPKYEELMRFNSGDFKTTVMLQSEGDAIDEFILFGESSTYGFGLIRILGKDMKPEKIMTLMEGINKSDTDVSTEGIQQFMNIFGR